MKTLLEGADTSSSSTEETQETDEATKAISELSVKKEETTEDEKK